MRFLKAVSVMFFVSFLAGCQSSEGDQPPRHTDAQGREIIPCTGDLCFDPDEPAVAEARDYLIEIWAEFNGEVDFESIQEITDSYAACAYSRGPSGYVQVDCPDWVRFKACPTTFYWPLGTNEETQVELIGNPNRHYCLKASEGAGSGCGNTLACDHGTVCAGEMSYSWADQSLGHPPNCVTAKDCLWLATRENVKVDESTCFYSDFTLPVTGVLAEQDCDSLAENRCAANCACDPVVHPLLPELQTIDSCKFVSEERPVGICTSSDTCFDGASCFVPGSVCMKIKPPTWVDSFAASQQSGWGIPAPSSEKGFCVMKSACEAWAAENPGQVISGCDDVAVELPIEGAP